MEDWKPIKGHENHEISSLGRVRSKDSVSIIRSRWGQLCERKKSGKILSTYKAGSYLGIRFLFRGKNYYIHRLVVESFIGEIGDMCVNHKDGNKHNNELSNLEIVTRSQNLLHSTYVLGKTKGQFKKKNAS